MLAEPQVTLGKIAMSVDNLVRHRIEEEIYKHEEAPGRKGFGEGGGDSALTTVFSLNPK